MEDMDNLDGFDVMKWLRETRGQIYEETKDMTLEERRRWREERLAKNPKLSAWWNSLPWADEPRVR